MSGAGRGIWLLIPLMVVLVGDWRESCYFWRSGWFVDELLLDFRLVVERGSGVGRSWCRGVMESDGTGIGYWRSEVDDVIQETEVIV